MTFPLDDPIWMEYPVHYFQRMLGIKETNKKENIMYR